MLTRTFGRRSPWSPCTPNGFRIRPTAKQLTSPGGLSLVNGAKRGFRSYAENLHRDGPARATRSPELNSPLSGLRTFCFSSNARNHIIPKSVIVEKMDPSASQYGNFDLVKKVKLDYAPIELQKWTSRKTGLSVVHLDCESPLVKGYFVLRTEIFDDSGRPHTLEHLVFLGSEKYPYKGVLDNLANRAFSNGTNAWTANDHTAYTIATAGDEGFLRLLPVYLDHVLYPTMTSNGFVTEVHHINEKAEDAGVVYAEMQGREQTPGDLMALKMQRAFYPDGSAYRSETGGLMERLRVLTVEKIREYHGEYYVPHNLCLVVVGRMPTSTLLDVLQSQVEPDILKHGQDGPPAGWKRPFVETPSITQPQINRPLTEVIDFPEKDESQGEIAMSFVGPTYNDMITRKAIDLLSTYLTDSPVSPLMKEFVEIPSPLCTYIYVIDNVRAGYSAIEVYLGGVPTEELDGMHTKLIDALTKVAKEGVDMDRMATIITRDKLRFLNALESNPGEFYSATVINDFLYGDNDGKDIPQMMGETDRYDELAKWTNDQWVGLLKRYIIDNAPVIVLGKPSASLPGKLETEEKARIAAQKESLGEEGLAKKVQELEEAKKEHERPIPQKMLTSFPVPPVSSINWIPVKGAWNDSKTALSSDKQLQAHVEKDGSDLPFFVGFHHAKSSFVTISALLSTVDIPPHLLPHLKVYLNAFFSLPVTRSDGAKLTHEEVVKQLDGLSVGYDINFGQGDLFQNLIRITIRVEPRRYEEAVAFLKDLIYGAEFAKDRLEVTIAKVQQSLPELKRDGNTVLCAVSGDLLYDETSASKASDILAQMDHIPKLAQKLKDDPEAVISDFKQIRDTLTKPEGVRFSVFGNVLDVEKPRSPWKVFKELPSAVLRPPPKSSESLTDLGKRPAKKAVVVTHPSIESSYGIHTSAAIQGFNHADQAALRVACEVLDATESFLWRFIRGSGLAYGAYMALDVEAGHLTFNVYKAPDSFRAYEEGRKVIEGLVNGSIPIEQAVVDGAKSSIVYSTVRSVSTPGSASSVAFLNQALKGVSQDFGRELLEKMQSVTIEDVKRVLGQYVLPCFQPDSSVAVVVSSPAKAKDIAEQFTKAGFDVESRVLEVGADEADSSDSEGEGSEVSGR